MSLSASQILNALIGGDGLVHWIVVLEVFARIKFHALHLGSLQRRKFLDQILHHGAR